MYFRLWKSKISEPEEFNRVNREVILEINKAAVHNKP